MITKLDVPSGLSNLRLCVAYKAKNETYDDLPLGPTNLEPFEPVYEELAGWDEDVTDVRKWEDLPAAAQAYVARISEFSGVPVRSVSVGPERDQVVEVKL